MTEDLNAPVAEDVAAPTIFLPQPTGHRRGSLRWLNGLMVSIACSPEELADLVDEFMADPSQRRLELRDAQFNEPYWLMRDAITNGHLMAVGVDWVTNPAPELGPRNGGKVMVAREMPDARPPRMLGQQRPRRAGRG